MNRSAEADWERVMKVQEVVLRAIAKRLCPKVSFLRLRRLMCGEALPRRSPVNSLWASPLVRGLCPKFIRPKAIRGGTAPHLYSAPAGRSPAAHQVAKPSRKDS